MNQNIKVGFEYEGVIKNSEGNVVRFKDLSSSARKNIINNYETSQHYNNNPYDNYDCLAEIKTIPMVVAKQAHYKELSRDFLYTLFGRIEYMTKLFNQNGYGIDWCECDITDETHNVIIRDWEENKDISVIPDSLTKKTVYTLDHINNLVKWKSKDNRRRGGGLHITISGIENITTPNFIKELHRSLHGYIDNKMTSSYRKQLIFRLKEKDGIKLFEYMSFGFQLQKRYNLITMFNEIKHQFHWMEGLIYFLKENQSSNNTVWEGL